MASAMRRTGRTSTPTWSFAPPHPRRRLRPLAPGLGAALLPVLPALSIQRPAHVVLPRARQVLAAPAADQHYRGLLQVVAVAADVADHFEAVGQAHLRGLAQRRI